MTLVKKKEIQIFSDGSFNFHETIVREAKKIKIYKKDANSQLNSKEFENFKTILISYDIIFIKNLKFISKVFLPEDK